MAQAILGPAPDEDSSSEEAREAGLSSASADEGDRRRLTGNAITGVVRLAHAWGAGDSQGATLPNVPYSDWNRMKEGKWEGALTQDQLIRASALIGIFQGLHILFANDMADRWPGLANRGPVFEGEAPIAAMMGGGIPRMPETRRYIDALRAGL